MKKYIVSIAAGLVSGALIYYVCLPALNLQSGGFWIYLLVVLGLMWGTFAVCAELELQSINPNKGKKNVVQVPDEKMQRINRQVAISGLAAAVPLLVLLIGSLSSAKLFHASRYANMITVETADFATDMEEASSVSNIALMDTNSARIIGNRTMGSLSEVVSQYEISDRYSQINYQGAPKKVANLEYASFFKWLNNKKNGVPGYVMVNIQFDDPDKREFVALNHTFCFSSSKRPTWRVSKNISRLAITIIAAAKVTTIVSTHFVSGVIAIFSCMKLTNRWNTIQASIERSLTRYTHVMMNPSGMPLMKKLTTYSGLTIRLA